MQGVLGSEVGELFMGAEAQQYVDQTLKLPDGSSLTVRVLSSENRHTNSHTGLMMWDAAPFAARLLASCPQLLLGRSALELGAGASGLCALVASRWARRVVATDGSATAVDLLAGNVQRNASKVVVERLRCAQLVWGNAGQIAGLQRLLPAGFDLIYGADVVYSWSSVQLLFDTARQLLSPAPAARLLLVYFVRHVSEQDIVAMAVQGGWALEAPAAHSAELAAAAQVAAAESQGNCRVMLLRRQPV